MKPGKGTLVFLALAQCAAACIVVFRFWHPHPVWRIPVALGLLIASFLAASFEVGAVRGWMGRR